jgi:hypothetical protein
MDAGYYTDLLVNGVEQSQELSPCSEPPIHVSMLLDQQPRVLREEAKTSEKRRTYCLSQLG